jgi:microcystin degradation protein MlrC
LKEDVMRIALGGITHEANSFSAHVTDMGDFQGRQVLRGDEILENWRSTRTEQAGAMSVLADVADCEVVPTLLARALSGAPMVEQIYAALLEELLSRLEAAGSVDGVLLVLHGAMMSQGTPDATGELLRQVRALVGPAVPVVATLDLHANVTAMMAEEATALIGYQTAPHVDMYEAGQKAAHVLVETLRGHVRPTMSLVRLPMLLPPENSTHLWGPLSEVIGTALALEAAGEILHAGIYPVQPWMDTPDVASSVVVITDNAPASAVAHARKLADSFWVRRRDFVTPLVPPAEAIAVALGRSAGTVVLCDSADATTSGSTGDSTSLLQALLDAAPFDVIALANIVDPEVVEEAIAAGVGATLTVEVGGKVASDLFEAVTFTGSVKTISDGAFVFKGAGMHGVPHHMGATVVLVCGGIHLVVMSRPVSQWDPELYRSLGLEPANARMVQVKSPMAFRAAYEGIFDEVIVVSAPGAANPALTSLPWRQIGRPIYPLDPEVVYV